MADKLTKDQIGIYRKFRRHSTLYLDTVVYGELYERFRNKSIDLLLKFIEKFDLTVVSSIIIEDELMAISYSDLFEGVLRQYLAIRERKLYFNTYDKALVDDLIDKFGSAKVKDLTHLAIAISNNVDLFTSFNKDFIFRNRKKILKLAQKHGYRRIPEILDTNTLIEEIGKIINR